MNLRKHPRLILVLSSLFVLVCRCTTNIPAEETQGSSDGVALDGCRQYRGFNEPGGIVCSIPCDARGSVGISVPDGTSTQFSNLTYAQLQAQACNALDTSEGEGDISIFGQFFRYINLQAPSGNTSSSNAGGQGSSNTAPTEEPTEAPTEAPTDAPPVALKPYLAGTVTACDTYSRYINFPVRADAPAGGPPKMILNGASVNCSLANNNTILSCSYPQGLPFPIRVVALINDQVVNDFSFDGAICTSLAPQGPQGDGGDEGSSGPAPVIDCLLPENWTLPECATD